MQHVGGGRATATVTASDVESWLSTLDVKPVTKASYVRHLGAYFRYCKEQRYAAEDVTEHVRLERVPRRFPKALRPEEVEAVAAYAEANCRDGAERSSAWVAPLTRLGAETGLRRNELLHLAWDRVDLGAGHLHRRLHGRVHDEVRRRAEGPAVAAGARGADPAEEREGVRQRPGVRVRGRPIDPHMCSDTVKRYAVKAGVPRLTPHALRHTALTQLIERGVPVPIVQRFAGHADIATTMRYCSIDDDVYAERIVRALG
jgi:integrase